MTTLLLVAAGYLLGSMPWGYWLPWLVEHDDIRRHGSGNIGGTNVWRVYGWRLGLPVVLLDTLKGFAPALVATLTVSHLAGVLAGAAAAVLVLHRANIARLRAGTENRFRFRRPASA